MPRFLRRFRAFFDSNISTAKKSKAHSRREAFPVKAIPDPQKVHRHVTIKQLPLCLFLEIVEFLEWQDVLLLRMTCHHFATVCGGRAAWLHLYSRYKTELEPRQHWPDRPLEFYDAVELRNFVLAPFRADRALKIKNLAPSSQRTVSIKKNVFHLVTFIRGGRWFLWGTDRGEIHYFDLESSDLQPRVLIPSPYGNTPDPMSLFFAIDIDDEAPYLTFNIAVAVHWPFSEDRGSDIDTQSTARLFNGQRPCQVWRITAVPDQRGRVVDLKAEMLVSICEDVGGSRIRGLCLRNNRIAYSLDGCELTVVIDWTQVGQTSSTRTRRVIPVATKRVALCGDSWLFCITADGRRAPVLYQLYEISEVAIEGPVTSGSVAPVAPKVKLPAFARRVSAPFILRDSIRFVYGNKEGLIGGIVIPRCDPSKACLVKLNFRLPRPHSVGYNTAMDLSGRNGFSVAHYSWPDADGEGFVSPKRVKSSSKFSIGIRDKPRFSQCVMDKLSARVILLHSSCQYLDILNY